jgi:dolichol-phosphate mannosyltransferase
VLCVIDADLQHPPDSHLGAVRVIERGADMAVASRNLEGGGVSDWSVFRRIVSRTAQLIGLLILPGVVGRVSDPMSGYFMIRRSAIEGVELNPLGYKILIEVMARGRFPWVGEVPYVFSERAHGGSKATARVYLDYLRHLLRLRFSPLPVNRFHPFAVVGLSGVCVDMGLLYVLSDPTMLGWGLTRSKLIAAEMAILNNFIWNDTLDVPRPLRAAARPEGAPAALGQVPAHLPGGCRHQCDIAQPAVQFARHEPLCRQRRGHRRRHGWNFWLNLKLSWRIAEPPA